MTWLSSGVTNAAGEVSLKVPAERPGVRYRAFVPAGPVLGAEVASDLMADLPVSQPLTVAATPTRPRAGTPVAVTLRTPGTSATDLEAQVRRVGDTTWTAATARPVLVSAGVFRTTTTFASAGTWEVRAVRRAAGGFAASEAKPVRVAVTPPA